MDRGDRPFLPAGKIAVRVADEVQAPLRQVGDRLVDIGLRICRIAGPAADLERHVVPGDGDASVGINLLLEAWMQFCATRQRRSDALFLIKRSKFLCPVPTIVGAGQHTGGGVEILRGVPDLSDDIVGPADAAVDVVFFFPEAIAALPADLDRRGLIDRGEVLVELLNSKWRGTIRGSTGLPKGKGPVTRASGPRDSRAR